MLQAIEEVFQEKRVFRLGTTEYKHKPEIHSPARQGCMREGTKGRSGLHHTAGQ